MTDQIPPEEISEMETPPPAFKFPWVAAIGIAVLALAGIAMLAYAIYGLLGGTGAKATPVVEVPTAAFSIPTTTPIPTAMPSTETPTTLPTETSAATNTSEAEGNLKINQPANVRSGPGTNYPALGGLQPGDTAVVIGRDASAQWYVINYENSANGQGWVSNTVSTYNGDVNSLPVIAAPPPPQPTKAPPPTNTPIPVATATPAPSTQNGIVGDYFTIDNTTVVAGQDIWFNFKITNVTDGSVDFGLVAAHTDVGYTAKSYSGPLGAHKSLEWRDHLNIGTPGTYQVYLGICFYSNNECVNGSPPWNRLSGNITVVVQ